MHLPTDPLFWIVAAIAVTMVGLAKGGFTGVGMVATPMLALIMPPLQAVAIMIPVLLLQDAISVWAYRKHWDPWNLKVLIPGGIAGVCIAGFLAAYVPDYVVRLIVGLIGVSFDAGACAPAAAAIASIATAATTAASLRSMARSRTISP